MSYTTGTGFRATITAKKGAATAASGGIGVIVASTLVRLLRYHDVDLWPDGMDQEMVGVVTVIGMTAYRILANWLKHKT